MNAGCAGLLVINGTSETERGAQHRLSDHDNNRHTSSEPCKLQHRQDPRRLGMETVTGFSRRARGIMTVGAIFLPDTPNTLIQRGKNDKGRAMLKRNRGTEDVDQEYTDSFQDSRAARYGDCYPLLPAVHWHKRDHVRQRRVFDVCCDNGASIFTVDKYGRPVYPDTLSNQARYNRCR